MPNKIAAVAVVAVLLALTIVGFTSPAKADPTYTLTPVATDNQHCVVYRFDRGADPAFFVVCTSGTPVALK